MRGFHRTLVLAIAVTGLVSTIVGAPAQTSQPPAAAQPVLPPSTKPGSPVVESIVSRPRPPLEVHKRARARLEARRRRHIVHRERVPLDIDRPALAGVELLLPLPRQPEPPHIVVPLPAYPLDTLATAFLAPPPPVVCHRTRRIRDLPDPRLYREVTVACEPDNP